MEAQLGPKEFALFRAFVYDNIGISLNEQKFYLVQGRLAKRLRELKLPSYQAYYDMLVHDSSGTEMFFFFSLISTNVTSFFREEKQWIFLKGHLTALTQGGKLRIWSAACSSGEEPYTIAMFLKNELKERFAGLDVKVLATDISQKVLKKAIDAEYTAHDVRALPKLLISSSFDVQKGEDGHKHYHIKEELRRIVTFRMFNLVYGDYRIFKKPFDIIFCRNVLIYFDNAIKQQIIDHFYRILRPGGYLLLGHSESLIFSQAKFKLIGSSIYQKE